MRAGLLASIALLSFGTGCGTERPSTGAPPPSAANVALGGTHVARVGDATLDRTLVLAVARARNLPARAALDALVDDALLADAARRDGAESDPAAQRAVDAVLSRALLARMREAAVDEGPWTDAELAEAAKGHPELSHAELRTVLHALVPKDTPNGEELAKELQAKLEAANGPDPQSSAKAFRDAAAAFPPLPGGKKLVVEDLPRFDATGAADGGARLDADFAKGAFAIPKALGTSGVVSTPFGFHVIRLLAIDPAFDATRAQKIERLRPELVTARVKHRWDALLARLREATPAQLLATDQDLGLPR